MQGKKNPWLWNGKESAFHPLRNRKKKHQERGGGQSRRILFPILVNVSTDAVKHRYQKQAGDERV